MGSCSAALGGQVADAALDGQVDLDGHVVRVEGQQVLLGVDDLDVGVLGRCRRAVTAPAPDLTSLSWTGCGA